MDFIICPLGHFSLFDFVVGQTLFRWEDNAMKFPVHSESVAVGPSYFDSGIFFVVGSGGILLHIYVSLFLL